MNVPTRINHRQKEFILRLINNGADRARGNVRLVVYISIVSVIILATFRNWFFTNTILTRGDWTYFTNVTLKSFRLMYFHVWLSDKDFGRTLIDLGQAPSYAAYGALAKWLGLGYPYGERLIHMIPAVVLAPVGSYLLLRLFTKRLLAIGVGTAVFCCNTYFLQLLTGDITIATAYAISPFVLYTFIKHLRQPTLKSGIIAGLTSILMCSYEPRIFYVAMIAVVLYIAYASLSPSSREVIFAGIKGTLITATPFILILLMCFYWLVGVYVSGGASDATVLSRNLFGSNFFVLQNALVINQPFWTGAKPQPFIYHTIFLNEWIIPIGALLSLYLNKTKRIAFYAAILVVAGTLFGKQQSEPFSALYPWLYAHVPGFNAFREASKFYLLVALGGAILLALLTDNLLATKKYKWLKIAFAVSILAMLLINLKPFFTGQIDSTVTARTMPSAYVKWNAFIEGQPGFSRVLWFPTRSRWADDTSMHPNVSAADTADGYWKGVYQNSPARTGNAMQPPEEQKITSAYTMGIAQELTQIGSIKYVVVPIRDLANEDDFFPNYGNDRGYYLDALQKLGYLKKLNLHMDGLVVYENRSYRPYVTGSAELKTIPSTTGVDSLYNFSTNQHIGDGFNFSVSNPQKQNNLPTTGIQDIFTDLSSGNFSQDDISPNIMNLGNGDKTLYANMNRPELSYRKSRQTLSIYSANPNKLLVDNHPVGQDTPKHLVYSKQLVPSKRYYVGQGTSLMYLGQNRSGDIAPGDGHIQLFSADGPNMVPDASFESGPWQKDVEDCNNYDRQYDMGNAMWTDSTHFTDGRKSLVLAAFLHTACTTSKPVPVSAGGYYRFSFDYMSRMAKYSGYALNFNDTSGTKISERIQKNGQWSNYSRLVKIPDGATNVTIRLFGYPQILGDNGGPATTNYDNVTFSPLALEGAANVDTNPSYTKIPVNAASSIEYKDTGYSFKNLIPNPSFESGLWQKHVNDCDDYDNNPIIGMHLDNRTASDGHDSLELNAERHIACTNTNPLKVTGGSRIYLNFSYQSSDDTSAHYGLAFNDPSHTTYAQQLPIQNTKWSSYSTIVTVPAEATSVTVSISTIPSGGRTVVRYDNFHLMEVPDVQGSYFLVNQPRQTFTTPRNVDFKIVNPTERLVKISGATTSFFLNMGEAYNGKWRLEMDNAKVHKLGSWLPTAKPDAVPHKDHYELDDFANGWYVNVDELCKQKNLCTRNSDGSYNLNMEVEFVPQRWLNVGMIISGGTLAACAVYLWRDHRRRRQTGKEHYAARR